jgi:hypothetical protein
VRFFFAVRYIKNARQTSSLPCARNKTHGKDFDARQTRVFPLCDHVLLMFVHIATMIRGIGTHQEIGFEFKYEKPCV